MTEGIVQVRGGTLYFEQIGAGEPLVLIHAGIADSRMWDDQVRPFAERFHVIRYDVRGFGRSTDPAGDFAHHEDLRAVLDHLSLTRAHLVAVSMAGAFAIDFTLAYPERVGKLVLVATFPRGYDRWSQETEKQDEEERAALEAGDIDRAIEINLRVWVDGPSRRPGEVNPDVRNCARRMLELNLPRTGEGKSQSVDPPAVGRLGEIAAPTLVIVGDKDQPDIIESSRFLAREIHGASIEEMAGIAHLPNMEKPAEFNRLVLDFLAADRAWPSLHK